MTELDKNRLLNGLRRYLAGADDDYLIGVYAKEMCNCDYCAFKFICGGGKLVDECKETLFQITEEHNND